MTRPRLTVQAGVIKSVADQLGIINVSDFFSNKYKPLKVASTPSLLLKHPECMNMRLFNFKSSYTQFDSEFISFRLKDTTLFLFSLTVSNTKHYYTSPCYLSMNLDR